MDDGLKQPRLWSVRRPQDSSLVASSGYWPALIPGHWPAVTLWIRCGQLHIKRFNEPAVCACAGRDRVLDLFFSFLEHVRHMLRLKTGEGVREGGRKVGGGGGVNVIIISLYKKPGGQKS